MGFGNDMETIKTMLHLESKQLARSKLTYEEPALVSIPAALLVIICLVCQQIVLALCSQWYHLCILIGSVLSGGAVATPEKELVGISYNSVLWSSGAIESNIKLNIKYFCGIYDTL